MNYKLLDDAGLVDLMKANDDLAFREIYLRYWREMFISSRKKVNDLVIAEDLYKMYLFLYGISGKILK